MNCPGQAVNPLFNPSPLTLPEQQNTPSNILYEIKSNFPALIDLYLKQIKTPGVPEQTGFFHCLLHYALVNVIRGIWKLPKPLVNVEPTQKISLHTPERVQTDIHHIVPKRKWNGSTGELVERLPAPLSDLYAESVEIYGQLLGPGNCLVNLILLPYNAHHQNVECIGANAAKYINPADHENTLSLTEILFAIALKAIFDEQENIKKMCHQLKGSYRDRISLGVLERIEGETEMVGERYAILVQSYPWIQEVNLHLTNGGYFLPVNLSVEH